MKISVITSYTNPEERCDPWKDAINCYESFADEIINVGQNWEYEFSWSYFNEIFQDGLEQTTGDWVFRMDVDYFFHENDIEKIKNVLSENKKAKGIIFPQRQFYTPDRYSIKTKICLAVNKKAFPEIMLNGGTDMFLPTYKGELLNSQNSYFCKIPLWQYDGMFRTKEIIAEDRARFARAWERHSGTYFPRGGPDSESAYDAWFEDTKKKHKNHIFKSKIEDHPVYIRDKLYDLETKQFGYDMFGCKRDTERTLIDYLRNYKLKLSL